MSLRVFYFVLFLFLLPIFFLRAYTLSDSNSVTISARVINSGEGEGGHGGSSGSNLGLPTTINFSGTAYPSSKVYILKDGVITTTTIADKSAHFFISLNGFSTDTYTFSVYTEDGNKRKSSFFSFPIYITEGTIVNIGNIFLSPTIDTDKLEVKKGDNLTIFGQGAPSSEVTISVYSDQEYLYKVISNTIGAYLYNLDTSMLNMGQYETKSKATLGLQDSLYSTPVTFMVGNENKKNNITACSTIRGDLNCDYRVNLIDFSIMAFWYKKDNPPARIDLSGDNKIDLVDFSIMVFNWTG